MSANIPAIPWNKLLAMALVLGLVGYLLARPSLERWWGVSLPSLINEQASEPTADSSRNDERPRLRPREGNAGSGTAASQANGSAEGNLSAEPAKTSPVGNETGFPPLGSGAARQEQSQPEQVKKQEKDPFQIPADKKPATPPGNKRESKREAKRAEAERQWEWRQLDRGRVQSPAGLIYGLGPQGEHRVDHVLRHAQDDPGRPVHGVFAGSREEIFRMIDEAYRLIGEKSKRVSKQVEGDRTEYTIRFDQAIGYEGGRNGQRNNYPRVNRLKLILEDDQSVITAYPVR